MGKTGPFLHTIVYQYMLISAAAVDLKQSRQQDFGGVDREGRSTHRFHLRRAAMQNITQSWDRREQKEFHKLLPANKADHLCQLWQCICSEQNLWFCHAAVILKLPASFCSHVDEGWYMLLDLTRHARVAIWYSMMKPVNMYLLHFQTSQICAIARIVRLVSTQRKTKSVCAVMQNWDLKSAPQLQNQSMNIA